MEDYKKILFIRRDNIGDLVCTTPAIRAVRVAYPGAKIAVLVNSYNAGAIADNSDIDVVYAYEKTKHARDKRALRVIYDNVRVLRQVRSERFDVALGCGYSYSERVARFTRLTGAAVRIGPVVKGASGGYYYTCGVPEPESSIHEVEAIFRLVEPLGVKGEIPAAKVCSNLAEGAKVRRFLEDEGVRPGTDIAVFHISSRKEANRWPVERFVALGNMLGAIRNLRILLLWSPGKSDNPMHPGDDEKAEAIVRGLKVKPLAYRTETLGQLIAALDAAKIVVCCDGGAMHLGAGLSKPVLTVWGTTDKRRWAPWGVKNVILQRGGNAATITAEEAFEAFLKLYEKKEHDR